MLFKKDANMLSFFIPTDKEERIECINPILATSSEKTRISQLINDINKNFDIGQDSNKLD
jgi:hypothetical protein